MKANTGYRTTFWAKVGKIVLANLEKTREVACR